MSTLLPLTHPEIEYRAAEQGKKSATTTTGQSAVEKQTSPTLVDILEVYQDRIEWKDKVDHSRLPEICPLGGELPRLRAFFFSDIEYLKDASGEGLIYMQADTTAAWLRQRFGVSPLYFRAVTRPVPTPTQEQAYFVRQDDDGQSVSLDGFYHFLDSFNVTVIKSCAVWFSHRVQGDPCSTYVFHNCLKGAKENLLNLSKDNANAPVFLRPLVADLFLAEDRLLSLQGSGGALSFRLFQFEAEANSKMTTEQAATAITDLHLHSGRFRHLRGQTADLDDNLRFLSLLSRQLSELSAPPSGPGRAFGAGLGAISESMSFLQYQTEHLLRWQLMYVDRISTQIGLLFNLANQLDSRTNLDIARLTSKISISSQRDSSSMITIAIVTMFFLPGTFVSAFFSMIFFDTKEDARGRLTMVVGPQVWIYVVATAILTIMVFCVWGIWHYHRIRRQSIHLDAENQSTALPQKRDEITYRAFRS